MEKLDKVIAGLECCLSEDRDCDDCVYRYNPRDELCRQIERDALELLKEYRKCLRFCGIRQYGMEGLNGND